MCGIFGVVALPNAPFTAEELAASVRALVLSSESRGKDASGVLSVTDSSFKVAKMPERGRKLLRTRQYRDVVETAGSAFSTGQFFVVAGHTRMVTHGSSGNPLNNQPVIREGLVALHNGIIVNDADPWSLMPEQDRRAEVDTEALVALIAHDQAGGETLSGAVRSAFSRILGANTIAVFSTDSPSCFVTTSNGSCFVYSDEDRGLTIFASEAVSLEAAGRALGIVIDVHGVRQLKPGDQLSLKVSEHERAGGRTLVELNVPSANVTEGLHRAPSDVDVERMRTLMALDTSAIAALRRCTRCVLPETFPFLSFDADGVCSVCRGYEKQTLSPVTEITNQVEEAVRQGRKPQVLVPISGGRDSCFGLHYVVRELGLDAVAYTYDWGYVTDRARRNISRMCGTLGVEHVLVAADLRRKRENVRRNIMAWSVRPSLGMIPLFMAGDKTFFKYASDIRRERNLATTMFSMSRLEPAGFKTGFAGVNEQARHDKPHGLQWNNTARLAAYYGSELVANLRYLNRSVPDSLAGFVAYYVKRMDYVQLFDHIPWDEELINSTIINEYGWERSEESRSTWRVGDATAPFYNFAYLAAAGFSEHDTFRSNQIREGMIDRETALAFIEEENVGQPRGFMAYCETTGIDPRYVAAAVRRLPRLY
jgi:hypothetical protein